MRKSSLFLAGVFLAPLTMLSMANAATVFDVSFDATGADADAVGSAPKTGGTTLPILHPSSISSGSGNTILIQNGTTAPHFSDFGSGKFTVLTSTAQNTNSMNFSAPSANHYNSGTSIFTFDYRRDGSVASSSGSFGIYFYGDVSSYLIGDLTISNTTGGMSMARNDGTGTTSGSVTNLTLAADTNYTIQSILVMNGANSTLDFKVTKSGTTTILKNGKGDSISLNGTKFYRNYLNVVGTGATATIAVDNVTTTYSTVVPEPASLGLLAAGGLLLLRRRR
jgi:hypothetical protein